MASDVHAHLYPKAYLVEVRKLEGAGGPAERAVRETLYSPIRQDAALHDAIDQRLALMDAAGIQTHVLSFSAPNDTVTSQASALRLAREVLGADRLVLGSDYPYVSRQSLAEGPSLLREAGFTDVGIEGVLRGNIGPALGLTGRPAQAPAGA